MAKLNIIVHNHLFVQVLSRFYRFTLSIFFILTLIFAMTKTSFSTEQNGHTSGHKVDNFSTLGKYKAWEAFAMLTQNETVCWISSNEYVANKDKKNATNSKSLLMLAIKPESSDRNEFSYNSVYNIAPDSPIEMSIDNYVRFKLYSEGKWAWLKSAIEEGRFVLISQKGNWLRLSGKTTRDKPFKETYSLSGFTDAYKVAFEECSKYMKKKKPMLGNLQKIIPKKSVVAKKPSLVKKK